MFTRPFRLGLERLDDRNAPSSLAGNAVASTDWLPVATNDSLPDYSAASYSDPNPNPDGNLKPVIGNFRVTVEPGFQGRFSGKVVDENPAGLTVTLTGPQGCLGGAAGKTVTTDAEGNFVFLGQLVTGVDCGVVSADTTDAQGAAADTAEYVLTV